MFIKPWAPRQAELPSHYEKRKDCHELRSKMNAATAASQEHVRTAETRDDSLTGRIHAQVDAIQAQKELHRAEFYSHAACPEISQLQKIDAHERKQQRELESLRNELNPTSLFTMLRNHGLPGACAWYRSSRVIDPEARTDLPGRVISGVNTLNHRVSAVEENADPTLRQFFKDLEADGRQDVRELRHEMTKDGFYSMVANHGLSSIPAYYRSSGA